MSSRPAPSLVADPHAPGAAFSARRGVVAAFDDRVGAGLLTDAATGEAWYVHCTRITDGSRTLAVGAAVAFRAEPGPTGLEAVAVAVVQG